MNLVVTPELEALVKHEQKLVASRQKEYDRVRATKADAQDPAWDKYWAMVRHHHYIHTRILDLAADLLKITSLPIMVSESAIEGLHVRPSDFFDGTHGCDVCRQK